MAQSLISNSKRDRLLNQCENLLLRGINSPTDVAESLNVSFNTAKAYISLVQERWALSSNVDELQLKRLELIKKTEEIIKEAWILRNTAKNNLEASSALRVALAAIERLERLQGIDSLPLPIEKPQELQTSELAHKLNTTLSPEARQMVINSIRKAIKYSRSKK